MEGYLCKWTNFLSGWQNRYFHLKQNLLYYFLLKDEESRGKFILTNMSLALAVKDNDLKFEIIIGTGEIIYLKASTHTERDLWVNALKIAILHDADNINIGTNNDLVDRSFNKNSNNEEKITKKIYKIKKVAEKLIENNEALENILKKYEKNSKIDILFRNEIKAQVEINKVYN